MYSLHGHWRIMVDMISKIYDWRNEMLVAGVNKILNWCQIISGGRRYTCRTKIVDGKLFFHFKREWHCVTEYISDQAHELVFEGGKVLWRPFRE